MDRVNNIINSINSTEEQVTLAKKWLEFGQINVIPIYNKEVMQILSSNWEEEILQGSRD